MRERMKREGERDGEKRAGEGGRVLQTISVSPTTHHASQTGISQVPAPHTRYPH